jgi:hypothetical protein
MGAAYDIYKKSAKLTGYQQTYSIKCVAITKALRRIASWNFADTTIS